MKHSVSIYKGEEHVTRKEFDTFEEAMAYLAECSTLDEVYKIHYIRSPSKQREVLWISAGPGVDRSTAFQTH